jgi:uncharacterized protein YjiS (DUF1127 family)
MSGHQQTVAVGSRPVRSRPLVKIAFDVWARVAASSARASERRDLARLSDWQLRDVGISRAEADAEAGRWFWRP